MRSRHPYIARPEDVTITRRENEIEVRYREKDIHVHVYRLDSDTPPLSDDEVLDMHNETLRERAALAAKYKHIAVELPLNSPQIMQDRASGRWSPRGGVIRCAIDDNTKGELVFGIDKNDLTLREFGQLLETYIGWGMRIEFVPEDEMHRRPRLSVREPAEPAPEGTQGG
jgi:hypothetical protein